MPEIQKNKKITGKKKQSIRGVIDPSVVNYENHPYFLKKAAEMKALIDKVGLPAAFYDKK